MPEGVKNLAAFELRGCPFDVPSEESKAPFFPIWKRSLLPSCVNFCTIPDGELAIQTLPSLSKKQLWRRESMTLGSPHELTTSPAESSSIIGGAIRPPLRSASATSCRLRM